MTALRILSFLILVSFFARDALAQTGGGPTSIQGVVRVLNNFAGFLFVLLIGLAVIFFLLAGYKYLFFSGRADKVQEAHQMMLYGVVAVAVGVVARGVVFLVDQIVR